MRGTVYLNKKFLFFLLVLPVVLINSSKLKAQAIIKEEIEIKENDQNFLNRRKSKESIGILTHNSYWEWYQHVFKPEKKGELKIALINAESYLQPLDTTAYFEIEIWGKDGRRDTTVKAKLILGKPITGSLSPKVANNWYLYGKGPFHFDIKPFTSEWGKDATVRLLHKYEVVYLDEECAPFCVDYYKYMGQKLV